MKILKIELQNINSLKADKPIVIDFESDAFQNIGLYAITGATGAGKTTILDAITVALYNRVPRFNRSHIKSDLVNIVSHYANSAFSRVTFEIKGVVYEAQWSIRTESKTGKVLTKPLEGVYFKNITEGKILAEKKKEMATAILEVTQLTYNQFLRSVMLAQGEFEAFLSAPAKDKGVLLEQITGNSIYKRVGEVISERVSTEKSKLNKINARFNSDDILSEEQIKKLLSDKVEIIENIKYISQKLERSKEVIEWFKKENQLKLDRVKLDGQRVDLDRYRADSLEILNSLKLNEEAELFKDSLETIKRCRLDIATKEENLKVLNGRYKRLEAQIGSARLDSKRDLLISDKQESELNLWIPKLEEVSNIDERIKSEKEQRAKIDSNCSTLISDAKKTALEIEYIEKSSISLKAESKTINEYLKKYIRVANIEPHFNNWSRDLILIKDSRERILVDRDSVNTLKKENSSVSKSLDSIKKELNMATLDSKSIESKLTSISKKLRECNLKNLIERREFTERERSIWREQSSISATYCKLIESRSELTDKIENSKAVIRKIDLKGITLADKIADAEKLINETNRVLQLERTIKSLDSERSKLEENRECPLCGSTTHPKVELYIDIELSKTEAILKERTDSYNTLIKERQQLDIEVAKQRSLLEIESRQLKQLSEDITTTIAEHKKINREISIDDIKLITDKLDSIEVKLKELTRDIKEAQDLQVDKDSIDKEYNRLKDIVNRHTTDSATLNEKFSSLTTQIRDRESGLKILEQETLTKESELTAELLKLGVKMPNYKDIPRLIYNIESEIEKYNEKRARELVVKSNISELNIKLESYKREQLKATESIEKCRADIKGIDKNIEKVISIREAILPLNITPKTKRDELLQLRSSALKSLETSKAKEQSIDTEIKTVYVEIANSSRDIRDLERSLNAELTEINSRVKGSSFNSQEEVANSILSREIKLQYTKISNSIQERAVELKTLTTKLESETERHKKGITSDINLDEIDIESANREYIKNQELHSSTLKRAGEIDQQLTIDSKIKSRNSNLTKEKELQEVELKRWEELLSLLGGSKHSFNTYVQRLTLITLIEQANINLYKLNRRYSLNMSSTYAHNEELNFHLIDHYNGDESRNIETSSGGEKFIISLALALGLSTISSNNVKIESLFIDEGFGTLDSTTLETVISTLETLQSQGKMIGIISHVENLKERISTQIKVIKGSNGTSSINIV